MAAAVNPGIEPTTAYSGPGVPQRADAEEAEPRRNQEDAADKPDESACDRGGCAEVQAVDQP